MCIVYGRPQVIFFCIHFCTLFYFRLHHPIQQLAVHQIHHHLCVQEVCADNKGLPPSGLVKHLQLVGGPSGLRGKSKNPVPEGGLCEV